MGELQDDRLRPHGVRVLLKRDDLAEARARGHDRLLTFDDRHGIALDWVYEAKMMYGLFARIAAGTFAPGSTIVAVLC